MFQIVPVLDSKRQASSQPSTSCGGGGSSWCHCGGSAAHDDLKGDDFFHITKGPTKTMGVFKYVYRNVGFWWDHHIVLLNLQVSLNKAFDVLPSFQKLSSWTSAKELCWHVYVLGRYVRFNMIMRSCVHIYIYNEHVWPCDVLKHDMLKCTQFKHTTKWFVTGPYSTNHAIWWYYMAYVASLPSLTTFGWFWVSVCVD